MSDDREWDRLRFEALFGGLGEYDASTPRGKKRLRILQSATELFIAHGYKKTSIEDVARAAGVAKGTVYTVFENKAQLLLEAIAVEKRIALKVLAPILDGEVPAPERLGFYVRHTLALVPQLPLSTRLLRGDDELARFFDELDSEWLAKQRAASLGMLADLIELAAPGRFSEEERKARAGVLAGLGVHAAVMLDARLRGPGDYDSYLRTLEGVVMHGLLGPSEGIGE